MAVRSRLAILSGLEPWMGLLSRGAVAGVGSVIAAAVGASVALWLGSAPEPRPLEPSEKTVLAPAPARERPERPERRERPEREPRTTKRTKAEKTPALPPEERAVARAEVRSDIAADIEARLADVAIERGWDPEVEGEVLQILLDTEAEITQRLADVDLGLVPWEEEKASLREYRLEQAAAVERLLGPEEFAVFTSTLGFARFEGDEPVRGRLR